MGQLQPDAPGSAAQILTNTKVSMTEFDKKGIPYSITERKVPELLSGLGSQPAGDVSH